MALAAPSIQVKNLDSLRVDRVTRQCPSNSVRALSTRFDLFGKALMIPFVALSTSCPVREFLYRTSHGAVDRHRNG
eukprot:6182801-Amphidinium_carterae.1